MTVVLYLDFVSLDLQNIVYDVTELNADKVSEARQTKGPVHLTHCVYCCYLERQKQIFLKFRLLV